MSNGHWVIELARSSWGSLSEDEKKVFDDWLKTATRHDVYLLIRHVRQATRRGKMSSVQRFLAVQPAKPPKVDVDPSDD